MTNGKDKSAAQDTKISCLEIQEHLFEFITHELGEGRSDLIHQHLRKCPECQEVAADIQRSLDVLHSGSYDWGELPGRLTDERRAKIVFAFSHPFLDWAYRRHVLVSVVVTIIAILLFVGVVLHLRTTRSLTDDPGIPVRIGDPPTAVETGAHKTDTPGN